MKAKDIEYVDEELPDSMMKAIRIIERLLTQSKYHEQVGIINQQNRLSDENCRGAKCLRLKQNFLCDMTDEEKEAIMGLKQVEESEKARLGPAERRQNRGNRGGNRGNRTRGGRGLQDIPEDVDHA